MSNNKLITALSIAAGTAFVASLTMSTSANAAQGANPFAMSELSSGYMQLAEAKCGGNKTMTKDMEGKCGEGKKEVEGKCGEGKKASKDGKCGEGKCGGSKEMKKNMEGNCGGKQGMDKDMPMGSEKGKKDGKCGEGKCGGKK